MRKTKVPALLPAVVGLAMLFFAASVDAQHEEEAGQSPENLPGYGSVQVLRISRDKPLFPLRMSVERGTTVIWANNTEALLSIQFSGGQEVRRSCSAPTGFHITSSGTYSASGVNPGGVASLCFVEEGNYPFQLIGISEGSPLVDRDGNPVAPVKGEIIVY